MKTVGIIVEYNPLHNGHLHHIKKTRELSKCDYLIAVMSSNFVQRGEPAIIDKFTRTSLALKNGIDLVIELPFAFSVQSADIFAYGAISILNHLSCDEIYFGSEEGEIEPLKVISDIILSDGYNNLLKTCLSEGDSYPTASSKALNKLSNKSNDLFNKPNNILGIQYINAIKKLNSKIIPKTIKRISSSYHDTSINPSDIQSATTIRKLMKSNLDISKYVPLSVYPISKEKFVDLEMFFDFIKYKIKSSTKNDLHNIFGMDEGLENRFAQLSDFQSIEDLIKKVLSKRYTNSRIKRLLIYILCNIKKDEMKDLEVSYIRVLGMNLQGRKYLNYIKKDINVPIITNIKKDKHTMLEIELRVSKIYSLILGEKFYKMEFSPLIIEHNN